MPEENEAGLPPGRARLPGFDEQPGRGGGYAGRDNYGPYLPPGGYEGGGYPPPAYARDSGVRAMRRTSTWTAAALIAAVAATTGYLAHAMPAASTGGTTVGQTTTTHSGAKHSGTVKSGAPRVSGPVVTSGGSGVAAGRAGGGGGGGAGGGDN